MEILLFYMKDGVQAVDIKILPEENTLRVRPSKTNQLPPPKKDEREDDSPKIKPI